jgi:hypothetical protein
VKAAWQVHAAHDVQMGTHQRAKVPSRRTLHVTILRSMFIKPCTNMFYVSEIQTLILIVNNVRHIDAEKTSQNLLMSFFMSSKVILNFEFGTGP